MALDLGPEELYSYAVKIVERAERRLRLLRLQVCTRGCIQKVQEFSGLE
jgi:hypothetical protein